ncbi:MotA/TolQ/ExbB proton channel family protein [Sphingomonas donggukensis]|uniref:MotA/TolQ/ExbB proton channel family protein n=1 Tax=Sphingomonas donggukensis TaxID=2949093 RepID=A0ABY4TT90_9SPHN|nr:MotA/TolQ/ExbB proton channel family protein [Sphingomonas donggukensis]URW75543.1 MotA/TolQ/ExbB proton channel family protein [Sphingomonas donggukensis]
MTPALAPFLDPVAIAIVGGGTLLATALRTPLADLGRGIAALTVLPRRLFTADALLTQIDALSRISARHGVMQLDRSVIADADVGVAIAAIVDGADADAVTARLDHARTARFERQRAAAEMWAAAAEIAPAMGMVGTLVGLVRLFTAMTDPSAIGGAMAIAVLATLYGALIGNLLCMPIAARLKRLSRAEYIERARLIAPLAELAERELPRFRLQDAA